MQKKLSEPWCLSGKKRILSTKTQGHEETQRESLSEP